jgi:hypothetical protein
MYSGIIELFEGSLAEMGFYMTVAFFLWFLIKVSASLREDLQYFKCDHIASKLPLYKQAME